MNQSKRIMRLQTLSVFIERKMRAKGFNVSYKVENVYEDFGAGTTHDTIAVHDNKGESIMQIFSPKQLREIDENLFDRDKIMKVVKLHEDLFNTWNIQKSSL